MFCSLHLLLLGNDVSELVLCDSHAYLVSKDSSVIGGKSPSPVFSRSSLSSYEISRL